MFPSFPSFKLVRQAWAGLFLPMLLVVALLSPGPVQAGEPTGLKVKSAFVPHLIGFVSWPASAFENDHSPIRVGILGDFPLTEETRIALARQQIHGRSLIIGELNTIQAATNCQVVLVGRSAMAQLPELLTAVADRPVFTLGDTDDFAGQGGMMNFLIENDRVRFKVNVAAARRGGLTISSRLLQVASVIHESPADPAVK